MDEFPPPKYIDDVTCPDLWVETSQTLQGPPGTIRIEFCVNRLTHLSPVHIDRITPVARLVMPIDLAQMLKDQLTAALSDLEQKVALANTPPASPTKN